MSYILDALKKSEQERDLGQVPTLDTKPYISNKEKSSLPLWFGACGIFAISVAGAFLYFDQQRSESFPPSAFTPQPNIALMETVPVAKEESNNSVAASMDILLLENPEFVKHETLPVSVSKVGLELATETTNTEAPVAEALSKKVVFGTENIEEPNSRQVDDNSNAKRVASIEIPVIDELSTSLRQRIPDLLLNVHVYDDDPAERFVLLNMKRYKEGEQTREGLVLEEILPNGVVMSLSGTPFRVMNQ